MALWLLCPWWPLLAPCLAEVALVGVSAINELAPLRGPLWGYMGRRDERVAAPHGRSKRRLVVHAAEAFASFIRMKSDVNKDVVLGLREHLFEFESEQVTAAPQLPSAGQPGVLLPSTHLYSRRQNNNNWKSDQPLYSPHPSTVNRQCCSHNQLGTQWWGTSQQQAGDVDA